jgi:hypothetical protein
VRRIDFLWRGSVVAATVASLGLVLAGCASAGLTASTSPVPTSASAQSGSITTLGKPVTTDRTTTDQEGDLRLPVADGEWWLRVDRQSRVEDVKAQSELLPESAYQPVDEVDLTFRVVISGGGTEVFFETYDSNYQVRGTRPSIIDGRIWYDTDAPWGGRFVIWQTPDGLQAEETMYGEGHPILHSYRGKLVKAQPGFSSARLVDGA